ncbi:hypothetical protein INT45_003015 [Circinella minor]|uniref:MULE transposase domain-containing protein n=1 Tax=Circinella minor TaxID=1195481 RepID=A0A8H7RI74_9FUNG|nr:hypothetical protein INT45_003015 [Circinella minor]
MHVRLCEMTEVEEFYVDSIYKTNHTGHELFSILASVNRIRFLIAHFLLRINPINEPINSNDQSNPMNHTIASTDHTTTINTSNSPAPNIDNTPTPYAPTTEKIREAIQLQLTARFFTRLHSQGLNPRFMFTDKDEDQISAISQVFSDNAVRLCLWHLMRTVKLQLAKPKLSNPQYNINEAINRFPFVSRQFQPAAEDRNGRRYENTGHREAIVVMMQKHYHMQS